MHPVTRVQTYRLSFGYDAVNLLADVSMLGMYEWIMFRIIYAQVCLDCSDTFWQA